MRRGFSIGEVIFALVLLSMAFFALLDLLASGPRAARRAQHETTAAALASSLLEEKRHDFGTLATAPDLTPYQAPDGVVFTPAYTTFVVPGTDSGYLRGVHVEVGWVERGIPCRVILETQVCDVLEQ